MSRRTDLLLAGLAILATLSCRPGAPPVQKRTSLLMDTYATISVFAPGPNAAAGLDSTFARLEQISSKFNHLDSTSPLYAFNERNVAITDPEVIYVLEAARRISTLSGGAFDVTVEPLVRLWGFYDVSPALPEQRQIDSCLEFVGYQNLVIDSGRVTKRNPETRVDLGGIAKGYGLAEAARVLRKAGVDSALIDLGGDVYAIGRKGSQDWRVGIRSPRGEGIVGVVKLHNLAAVSSGDYERFFWGPDSVRYCHILNPHTGWPARGFCSTTVLMRDPLLAQGLSKVLFILGPEALSLADSTDHFEALLIDDSMKAITSAGLAGAVDSTLENAARQAGSKQGNKEL
ncbi:FAD:protein FMN transferase [candidate division WOR-3 bacterium]|nr:FAD:protein FMN transferase [candidate division WOR-3 bacterium]